MGKRRYGEKQPPRHFSIMQYDLKDVQKVILDVALEIDRICRKNEISYSLAFGSLLGAVRHGGFIPWDDDMDLIMLREDYERFKEACKKDLGSGYFLMTPETEPEYPFQFAKVVKEGTLFAERGYEYKDIHKGVYVDIFPLDNVFLSSYKMQHYLFSFFRRAKWRNIDKRTMPKHEWKLSAARKNTWFTAPFSILGSQRLDRILNWLMCRNNGKRTEYVYVMAHPNGKKYLDKRAWYDELVEMDFEGHRMYVPKEYKKILRRRYGDYMKYPPKKEQKPSHDIIAIRL